MDLSILAVSIGRVKELPHRARAARLHDLGVDLSSWRHVDHHDEHFVFVDLVDDPVLPNAEGPCGWIERRELDRT